MNLKDVTPDRLPIRGLQQEVESLKKQVKQMEEENTWLRKILAELQVQEDNAKPTRTKTWWT